MQYRHRREWCGGVVWKPRFHYARSGTGGEATASSAIRSGGTALDWQADYGTEACCCRIGASDTIWQWPSFVFHGPFGLVQSGDGSQATVHQHVDAGIRTEIASTLHVLIDQLDKPENNAIGNRAELRELIVEAQAEAEKPEPNTLKLGASLRTIAETTKFVGSLGPAYQVLKPLLSYFGIHLP